MRPIHVWLLIVTLGIVGSPAARAAPCADLDDRRQRQRCVDKQRKGTQALRPGQLSAGLAYLDANNPLDRDRFYVGLPTRRTGIRSLDRMVRHVAEVEAMVALVRYSAQLERKEKATEAGHVLEQLLPVMKSFEPRSAAFFEQLGALPDEVRQTAQADPLKALKASTRAASLLQRGKRLQVDFPPALREAESLANAITAATLAD